MGGSRIFPGVDKLGGLGDESLGAVGLWMQSPKKLPTCFEKKYFVC